MISTGSRIGHIEIGEELGAGAMGSVYAGVDHKLHREVAVKVLRHSYLPEDRARLLTEARVLSRLDHPNVCRVYDFLEEGGTLLVLERIRGRTLKAVLAAGLEPSRRLPVALQLAEALAAAHARGIVHRDLKPANVMLTEEGRVKVLDFGLARPMAVPGGLEPVPGPTPAEPGGAGDGGETVPVLAAAGESVWLALPTRHGAVVGTPLYMSPEQARGEEVSTASDVYSLGLLLQEVWSGRSAYGEQRESPYVLHLARCGETLPATGMDPELGRLLTQMKAVAPEARPTAAQVVERLRWVAAGPARRRRRFLAAALLALALGGMAKYTRDLRRERNEALVARQQAELARIEAEQVGSFLVELFEAPDPWEAPAGLGPPTAETLLARGVEKISTELAEQPEVRLRLLTAMASAYLGLGDYEQALALQQQVVELARELYPEDDPQRSQSLYDLARVHQHRREHRSAEEFYRQALAIQQRQPEPDDLAIARSLHGLAQAKLQGGVPSPAVGPLLRAALSIRRARIADDHRDLLTNLNDLGLHLRYQGRQEEAEQVFRELAGRLEQAAAMGPDHPARATVLGNLALALWQQGKLEEAETVARQSQATMARALGEAHPYVAAANRMLVRVLKGRGKLQEAEPYARAALEIARAGGEERIDTALYRIDLGQLYLYLDPPGPGEALVRQGHETLRRLLGEDDPRTIQALLSLAEASHRAGRRQEAARRYREALEAAERHLGEDDELTARVLLAAAQFDLDQGQGEAAEEKSRRLLARFEEHPPSWPWLTEDARSVLGAALGQQGRWAEAEPLLTGAHGVLEKLLGASSPDTRRARERLADFQRRRGASGPGGEPRQPVS